MRNIDLSVGSMLSFIGVVIGVAQVYWLPPSLGFGHPLIWIVARRHRLGARRGDRRLPGLHRRLSRHALLHRHAGRLPGLQRRRLVGDPRRDRRADGQPLRADRRHAAPGVDRRRDGAGRSASSPAWPSSSAISPTAPPARRFRFPRARSGPSASSALSAARCPGRGLGRQLLSVADARRRDATPRPTTSRCPPRGLFIPTASPSRC